MGIGWDTRVAAKVKVAMVEASRKRAAARVGWLRKMNIGGGWEGGGG